MQNFDFSKVRSFCSFVIPIVLILQLLSGGFALTPYSQNDLAVKSFFEDSTITLAAYAEDTEDEDSKHHSQPLNACCSDNSNYLRFVTNPYKENLSSLNHSRSPPLS